MSRYVGRFVRRYLPYLVGLSVLLPFVVASIRILSWDDGSPMGDWAALDLDVRSGLAVLGSYSQYGFRHPGPLYIWWMNWPRFVANGSSAYVFGATVLSATFVCA